MENLYNVDSPIDRVRRKNINDTFTDILSRFNNLQRQINILAGDNDVDELIQRIMDAINNSEATLADLQTALTDAHQTISDMITATTNAANAADAANQATTDATQLFNDMTSLQANLEQLQVSLKQAVTDASQATTAANTATNNANQATQDAQQATIDADNATSRANDAADAIDGWGQAVPYQTGSTYERNNVVTYEYSTYQSLVDGNTSLPTDSTKWIVLARKGLDGQGAVRTVNNRLPDVYGNVEVAIADIDGLNGALNNKANDTDMAELEQTVTKHLDDIAVNVKDFGAVGNGITDDTSAIQSAINQAGNGGIYFPPGFYLITNSIVINGSAKRLRLFGEQWASFIKFESIDGDGFVASGDNSNYTFEGLYFLQEKQPSRFIRFFGGNYHKIINCTFNRSTLTTSPMVTSVVANTQIINNIFVNNSPDSEAVLIKGVVGEMNINSLLHDNYFGGTGRGVEVTNDIGAPVVEGLSISGNKFITTGAHSIKLASGFFLSVTDNIIDQAAGVSVVLTGENATLNHVSLSDNYIACASSPTTGVAVNMVDLNHDINNVSIVNNKITQSGYGIILGSRSNNNIISNNSISDVTDIGVRLNNAGNTIFTGNTLEDCGTTVVLDTLKTEAKYILSNNICIGNASVTESSANVIKSNNFGI